MSTEKPGHPLRGEVWIVRLEPGTEGSEQAGTRRSVVLQNDLGNRLSNTTIIAPITSQQVERVFPFQVHIPQGVAGQTKDGKVLLNQIRTIDKRRLEKRVGLVPDDLMIHIERAVLISLGIDILQS